ncbi:MAG: hypothetical protein JWO60_259, partial [Frankiales bacterium]|nr:hypothetical protein [Frankiales bacterium]
MTATGVDHDDAPSPFAEPGLLPGLKRLAASSRAASSRSAQDAVVLAELALS